MADEETQKETQEAAGEAAAGETAAPKQPVDPEKATLKQRIENLKTQRAAALEAKDGVQLKRARRRIRRLKRKIRRRAAAPPRAESGAPGAGPRPRKKSAPAASSGGARLGDRIQSF